MLEFLFLKIVHVVRIYKSQFNNLQHFHERHTHNTGIKFPACSIRKINMNQKEIKITGSSVSFQGLVSMEADGARFYS